jgi:glycosyltransferase involved in cell wall biosynthesis
MPREDAKKALRELGMDTDKPFFLHVGGNFFYKNRKGLLGIFAQILTFDGGRDYRLALVGSPMDKELRTLCQGYGIAGRVIEAGNISNQQLCALYSTAEAFIFPSLYEGFGWPIIEAQACGCPVFTSTRPPMTEVGGEGAGYFPVENEKMAAQVILDGLQRRDEMIRNGFRNARKFTTEAMVDGYIERYHHIVRQASGRCAA